MLQGLEGVGWFVVQSRNGRSWGLSCSGPAAIMLLLGPQWLAVLAGAWQGMAADVTHASYLLTRILLALCLLSAAGGGGRADCSQDSSAAGADDGARECAGGLWVGAGATCDAGLQLDAASAHRLRIAHRPRIATPWQRACPVFKWGSQLAPLLATLIGSQVCC